MYRPYWVVILWLDDILFDAFRSQTENTILPILGPWYPHVEITLLWSRILSSVVDSVHIGAMLSPCSNHSMAVPYPFSCA